MNFSKIFFLALAAVAVTACSDASDEDVRDYPNFLDSKVNSAPDVTVSVPGTFSANENEQPFYIPVNVNGESNGKVVVTVEVKQPASLPAGTEAAKPVDHFNITSYKVNIAPGVNQGGIEVMPVWVTGEINDDRVFEVTIVKAEGATIASNSTCQVTIVNVDDPYTSMCGSWNLTCKRNGVETSYKINMKTVAAGSEDYGHVLYGFGFGDSDYLIPFENFIFDEATGTGTMEIGYGWMMTDGLAFNYGDPVGIAFPVCCYKGENGMTMNHKAVCTFDANYNVINIPADANIIAALFSADTQQYTGYTVGTYTDIKMTRK